MNIDANILTKTLKYITLRQKGYTPSTSGIYPEDTRKVQHMQMNELDTSHKQNEGHWFDHLNRC
jgi:hypothetical protein